jgi:flagellar biosynthetic protein FliO
MEIVQQMAAVVGVLALLGATLWWLKERGAASFGRPRASGKALEVVERLALGPQHSLHVVRFSGRRLLIAVSPSGCTVLDSDPRTGAPPVARLATVPVQELAPFEVRA